MRETTVRILPLPIVCACVLLPGGLVAPRVAAATHPAVGFRNDAPGVPAITPTRTVSAQAVTTAYVTATTPYTDQAAYTVDDVQHFLTTHRLFATTDGATPVIATILFIPSRVASAYMNGETVGRPDNVVVCYVELHGSLSTGSQHRHAVLRRVHGKTVLVPQNYPPAHVGVLVFDAQTGNLLIRGFNG